MPVPENGSEIRAICFDFMGTCLDWHSTIVEALPDELSRSIRSEFALEWRQAYFEANESRRRNGDPPEDVDITHLRVLDEKLTGHQDIAHLFTEDAKLKTIQAWHNQKAWPEVSEAIKQLKANGFEVFVHANGTTRLQLDIVKSSGLQFDMLFSSELLGFIKPAPENYLALLKLLKLKPSQCVMVACHAYDLRGAKAVGMKTVYIRRWTDDIREDQEKIKTEFDRYLEDMQQLSEVVAKI